MYAVSHAKSSDNFGCVIDDFGAFQPILSASEPKAPPGLPRTHPLKVKYCLHPQNSDLTIQPGLEVFCLNHLCPPYSPVESSNAFGHFFGIEYRTDDDTFC